jgi:ferredoxin
MMKQPSRTLRVWIDRSTCIGSESCVRLAPGTFQMGDDGVAHVIDPGGDEAERLRLAARSCPTGAIFIDES